MFPCVMCIAHSYYSIEYGGGGDFSVHQDIYMYPIQ